MQCVSCNMGHNFGKYKDKDPTLLLTFKGLLDTRYNMKPNMIALVIKKNRQQNNFNSAQKTIVRCNCISFELYIK